MAATVGVPLYACGGTIPLLQQWLMDGMKHFIFYIVFVMLFSLLAGMLVNLVI